MQGAVEPPPAAAGIQLANWYWRVVRQFVSERFGISRCRSSCLNWLYRLGFACQRPQKRLLKANESQREAFVAEYAALWEEALWEEALWEEAQRTEASIFFAYEAHFRADAELRGKWMLKGEPALVDSNSPRYGEKASYYSAVCLETGEVEWMELAGNSNSGTSVACLTQLPDATEGKASRAAAGQLGQCAGASWGSGAGVPQDARAGAEAGEPRVKHGAGSAGLQPGLQRR